MTGHASATYLGRMKRFSHRSAAKLVVGTQVLGWLRKAPQRNHNLITIRLGQTNRGDNEAFKTLAGANRRFCCGGFDFQKRDDFCPINQHRLFDYMPPSDAECSHAYEYFTNFCQFPAPNSWLVRKPEKWQLVPTWKVTPFTRT